MGNVSFKISKTISFADIYDASTFLFILSLFVFENATYAFLFSIFQALFIGMTLLYAFRMQRIATSKIYTWIINFLILTVASGLINSVSGGEAIISIIVKNMIRCVCLTVYLTSKKNEQKMIRYIAVAGIVCSVFILAEFMNAGLDYSSDLKYAYQDRVGASIAGNNVNVVALNMSFAFAAWMYLFHESKSSKEKLFSMVCVLLTVGATLLTGTRKILLFYIAVYAVYVVVYPTKRSRRIGLSIIIFLLVYYALLNIEPLYYIIGHKVDFFSGSNTVAIYDASDAKREELVRGGLKLFYERPVLGYGYGNTTNYLGTYAHNNYVEILASGGILGAIVYYAIYIFLFFKSKKNFKIDNFSLYIFASVVGLCVLEFFQVTYLYGMPWVFLALTVTYCEKIQ